MVYLNLRSKEICKQYKTKPEEFIVYFSPPIDLRDGDYEIALMEARIWYSWYNISEEQDNNYFFIHSKLDIKPQIYQGDGVSHLRCSDESPEYLRCSDDSGVHYQITQIPLDFNKKKIIIPDGFYDIDNSLVEEGDNQKSISYYFEKEKIKFKLLKDEYRCLMEIPEDMEVDLSSGKLYKILGYLPKIYGAGTHKSENIVDITNGIDEIYIKCSIIDECFLNGDKEKILYSFVPNESPSNLMIIKPFGLPRWLHISDKIVDRIKMSISYDGENLLNLNGENVSYELLIRRKA